MINALGKIFARLVASHVQLHRSATCPDCGSQLARAVDDANAAWSCPNPDCPPQVLKRVELWASLEAMDIQGCNAALVKQLVQRGLVRDAAEFYRLKIAELASLEGFDLTKARALWEAIQASKQREAWRVLFGLGIPNLGVPEAQALCKHCAALEDAFALGRERLAKLDGVTETVARSLTHWSGDPVNRKLVRRLAKAGINFDTRSTQTKSVN
ncbi:MAG: helix-hairpin-helix domain-containing protein [Verrucomicrobiota bacterium]